MRFGHRIYGVLLGTAVLVSALPAGAEEIDGSRFRAPEEGTWYHSVEPEKWVHIGGKYDEVTEVITRITAAAASAKRALPDDPTYQGEGSWLAEWNRAGEAAFEEGKTLAAAGKEAEAADRYQAAAAYFLQASSPHTDDPAPKGGTKAGTGELRRHGRTPPFDDSGD